jgi:hypothetical protein
VGKDQLIVGILLDAALLALAIYYGWRQLRASRHPIEGIEPESPEGLYRRKQIRRRLVSSGLMLIMAAQLAGALVYLEDRAQQQADRADARAEAREQGKAQAPPTAEERSFARLYGAYWLVFLLVLLAVVVLAFADLLSTRRFALKAHRQLQAERREMIARQIARLRQEKQERNGHG